MYKSSSKFKINYDEDSGVASLTFHQAEHIDSGKYRCEARNRLGRVHTDCRLKVNGKKRNIDKVAGVERCCAKFIIMTWANFQNLYCN